MDADIEAGTSLRLMSEEDLARALSSTAHEGEPYLANAICEELLHRVSSLTQAIGRVQDGVIAVDADGRITYLNPVAERALGVTTHEGRGQQLDDRLHAPGAAPGEPTIRDAIRHRRMHRWTGATLDTPRGPVQVTASLTTGETETGSVGGIVVFHHGPRARGRTQLEAQSRALAILALGGPTTDVFDAVTATLDAPPTRVSAILTLDPSRRKISHVATKGLPEELARTLAVEANALVSQGVGSTAAWREAWSAFGPVATSLVAKPIVNRHGETGGVILVVGKTHEPHPSELEDSLDAAAELVNATRERDHAELCRSLVESLFASSPDAIWSFDNTGTVTSWSRSAEILFGRLGAAAIGQNIADIFGDQDRATASLVLDQLPTQNGDTHHIVSGSPVDDGVPSRLALTIHPLRDINGVRVGASVFARRVTEPPDAAPPSPAPTRPRIAKGPHRGAPLPADEDERLAVLRAYDLLDTPAESALDDLTRLASAVTDCPIGLISLVDRDRQWFKSHHGLPVEETSRDESFCAHAILQPHQTLVVPDARVDERFANNPLVTGHLHLRSYAGVPLVTAAGQPVGTLCVLDKQPRAFTDRQLGILRIIADQVMAQIELRRLSGRFAHTLLARERLRDQVARLKRDQGPRNHP